MTKLIDYLLASPSIASYAFDELSKHSTNISEADVQLFVKHTIENVCLNGPKMYKVYTIPKRNGGKRLIAHPSKPLKAVQEALIEFLDGILPIHDVAFAYRKGRSIRDNAEQHKLNKYCLKMDLSNFFNSIDISLFEQQLKINNISTLSKDETVINNIIFWSPSKSLSGKLKLSVGAPSSPLVSNFIMYTFDLLLCEVCDSFNIKYTRYADDLFFSTNYKRVLFNVPDIVEYILNTKYKKKLTINESKTSFSSKAHNRHITGITITNDDKLSLGRNRKRFISSLVHKYKIEALDIESIQQLQGLLGFAKNIEPSFLTRLRRKYSSETIDSIMTGAWVKNEI